MAQSTTGRFVWYELLTTDTKAAMAFYKDVVGWTTQAFEGGYEMWVGSQGPLGGTMTLPEKAKQMGAPPHWMAHVQVANVEATIEQARKLDGKVFHGPEEIPKVGRLAIIGDPQGASLSVFTPTEAMQPHDTTKPGEFCWSELITSNHEAAFRFYSTLFGWEQVSDFDMGPMGKYLIYGKGEQRFGGMFTKSTDMPIPPSWLYYTQVADLEAAVARAKSKGAKLMNGPMEVPGGARIAQLRDPQGATFALHEEPRKN